MLWLLPLLCGPAAAQADGGKTAVLELARKGWVYELRSSMMRPVRGRALPRIDARSLRGARLCLLGEAPHPVTLDVIEQFSALLELTFGQPLRLDDAVDPAGCAGEPVVLRLFSDRSPDIAYNSDLERLDTEFAIGLPRRRRHFVATPAQAQTFFGELGQATHILVMQPEVETEPADLTLQFHVSILIEELYQAFTFGMDVLLFDRTRKPISKLQEYPLHLRGLSWRSDAYMAGLLSSNPRGLCAFDVLMLHALGESDLERTNSSELIVYIDENYTRLTERMRETLALPSLSTILDPDCAALPR
ncbi:hypothetical protein PMES_03075 [Profundibacterium mesophilum KAUST100406-0324]|uniref:Uncharacterized protein n=2 Tax=Profundibacterium TaxID=1258570 RepID=A0A921NNY9_9RHOB|nr:hypothetical protein PMES_03075 [Profundibacterium mesophilum KAUST100406-0324]